jgi:hypothetical protein
MNEEKLSLLISFFNTAILSKSERTELLKLIVNGILTGEIIPESYNIDPNVFLFFKENNFSGEIQAEELYKLFLAWCIENKKEMITLTKFGIEVKKLGYQKRRVKEGIIYTI